jgi:hypothetical protein
MKKFLVFSAILGSMVFALPPMEAKAATSATAADPQIQVRIGQPRRGRRNDNRRWNNRRVRTTTETRVVRVGRYRYREVVRVTYLPNGRVNRQVISRSRVGRW